MDGAVVEPPQIYWRNKARMVAWRWNVAAWLHLFLRFLLGASLVMMCALLMVRRSEGRVDIAWWVFEGSVLSGAVACIFLARKKFCTGREALVRLDATLRLNNRLTAASDGVGEWPDEQSETPDGLRWRWQRILLPPLASAAALLFAAYVPVPPDRLSEQHHKEEPLAWTRVESQLEALKKQDIVNQEAILTLEQQVEDLRKQSPEDWYSHSSLEASDNLQAKTNEAIRALKRDMESVSSTLDTLNQNGAMMTDEDLQKLGNQLQTPMQGLELGTLPLNKDLLDQLKNIDPNQLRNLTPQQLAQMQQNLQKGIQGAQASMNPGDFDEAQAELMGILQQGQGNGGGQMIGQVGPHGQGQQTNGQPGSGGPGGGGPPAPLGLKPDETNLNTNNATKLTSDDLSHSAVGDPLGVSKGQHQVDPSKYTGPASAGTIDSNGSGGEAVWKNDLTPQEREILERFYK
ncbi:MAG TPA: hypothetical protein VG733_08225 [Chthoniobacteraceae bacterium]|nr:hypothetical protein [Chthoniobacteraceae bacterium]